MADNKLLPASGAGSVITAATDEIGGVDYQRVKVDWGPDGTANDTDVASGKPLPVQLRGSDGTDRSNKLPVSIAAGDVAVGATSIAANEDTASADADTGIKNLLVRKDTPAANAGVSADADYAPFIADNLGQLWIAGAYKEDQAAADGDRGLVQLAKRQDTPAANANVSADADYAPVLVDNLGQLWTAGAYKEDQASADGDRLVVAGAKRTDTPANSSGTDGDYEPLQVSGGKLWVAPVGFFVTVSASITKSTTTTTYTVGDNWSDSTTAPTAGGYTFTGAARKSGGSGIITDVFVSCSVGPALMLQGELWIYDSAIATNDNDNAAMTNVDADVLLAVGVVPFTLAASAVGSVNGYAHIQNLNIGFTCVGSADLRFKVKVQNAYVNTASEVLNFRLKIIQTN